MVGDYPGVLHIDRKPNPDGFQVFMLAFELTQTKRYVMHSVASSDFIQGLFAFISLQTLNQNILDLTLFLMPSNLSLPKKFNFNVILGLDDLMDGG